MQKKKKSFYILLVKFANTLRLLTTSKRDPTVSSLRQLEADIAPSCMKAYFCISKSVLSSSSLYLILCAVMSKAAILSVVQMLNHT